MTLQTSDFSRFFEALWGYGPFPWQVRLLEQVALSGRYPDVLALGTGTGKTSMVDIHVFAQALDAGRPPLERRLPRRLFFVVDRRVIVDQTDERANTIAHALEEAKGGILREVADALRTLSDSKIPLATTVLRGGVIRDESWVHWPDQPLVVSSTVDQVGSRLLFRGYGVSPGMSPVHAALVGAESLIVLDEVHLAVPFRQTLEGIERHYRNAQSGLPDRWQVVTMSATPADARGEVFRLDDEDTTHPVLARRLTARRPAVLLDTKVKGSDSAGDRKAIAKAAVAAALSFLATHKAIGVVVNRVDIARDVWAELLTKREVKKLGAQVALVTGRMRGLDKTLVEPALKRVRASRQDGQDPETPVIIVSTQSLEAGADLDFDALVTQAASIDALQQRFGRLNRMGRFGSEEQGQERTVEAVILCPAEGGATTDPIYGDALDATVAFLRKQSENATVEFAIDQMGPTLSALSDDERAALSAPADDAPIVLPTYMDLWTQTRPKPWPDPEVAPFLHGPQRAPDVQLVWRSDIDLELLTIAGGHDESKTAAEARRALRALIRRFEAVPPSSVEALSVPIYAARAWLKGIGNVTIADVPIETLAAKNPKADLAPRYALRWAGDETVVVDPDKLRVGDTLVIPVEYGGLNPVGVWDPSCTDPVTDLGEEAQWRARGRAVLRPSCVPDIAHVWVKRVLGVSTDQVEPFETKREEREAIKTWLDALSRDATSPEWRLEAVRHLRDVGWQWVEIGGSSAADPREVVVIGKRPKQADRDFDPEASSHTSQRSKDKPVTLREHCADVSEWVRGFATRLGFPESVVGDLALAGRLHDLGKADPRFQLMLAKGDPVKAAMSGEPLAKSGIGPADKSAQDEASLRSRYPAGTRHEFMSLQLAQGDIESEASDPELVRHLISSHHGWSRPCAPPTPDPEPVEVQHPFAKGVVLTSRHSLASTGSGVAHRFATLNARYGAHGVAWLEALVRLADHRASQFPSPGGKS